MIKDNLKIHDKFSIEIKQSYYSLFLKKKSAYRVITYLFIPNGLNINKQTYIKEKFYNDIRVNIRYNSPEYTLEELIRNIESPLNKFVNLACKLPKRPFKNQLVELETLSKIFANVFNSAVRKSNRNTRKLCKTENKIEAVSSFTKEIQEVLKIYRNSIERIIYLDIDPQQKTLLCFTDEYISNITEHQSLILHNYILKKQGKCAEALDLLFVLIKREQNYKEEHYSSSTDSGYPNYEHIIHKRSQLKKYVDSIFFLNKDIRKDGAWMEHSIFAIAAGLAMLFSTGIAFYYQYKYGNFTSTFFIALIISYMMKDRIKSWVGSLFVSKAHSVSYDYKINIFNANKNKVGLIKEAFCFVPYKKLGSKIKLYRQSNRTINAEDDLFGEHIIEYKKKITLYPKKLGKELSDKKLNSIIDITRINLSRFAQNMDDPKKSYFFVKDSEIVKSEEDRVYHINIVQKFYTECGIEFKRYRVVINRNGIKRIEKVKLEGLNVLNS